MAPRTSGSGQQMEQKIQSLKRNMEKIRMDQQGIREEQTRVKQRFAIVKQQCEECREEINLISREATMTQLRVGLIFQIMRARKDGNFSKAHYLTRFLRFIV
ncbi:hypothetical protein V6N11_064501 [Hibiscus sabdariffa]|uniref:Uncharacterized protein n=2 Tax=Hibiscus sabdariffa TaxID=183260 RepID=A0ABR1ZFS0_9ROSI